MSWVALLSVMQIVYNTSVNQITDIMSFFMNHEYNANLFQESKKVMILTKQVNITVIEMQTLHKKLKQDIKFLLYRLVFYYNKYCAEASMLKKRDKVYLLWKNIETTRSSNKLNHVKIKSFRIIRNIKRVSFELKLLKDMQWKHFIFHVSLLELASDSILVLEQILDNYLIEQKDQYEVEKILKHKNINKQKHYLIKWKSYLNSENIWELEVNLNRCLEIIKKYSQREHSQTSKQD